MIIQTTYTQAQASLASLWDAVTLNREIVIIERRGAEPVALISADELAGLCDDHASPIGLVILFLNDE
jgi:PHD/YefM family antitoxin component YafN of YafNO toxin-antitoxin module